MPSRAPGAPFLLSAFVFASLAAWGCSGTSTDTADGGGSGEPGLDAEVGPEAGGGGQDATMADGDAASLMGDAAVHDAPPSFDVVRPPDPCASGTCPTGTWIDVTPPGVNLTTDVGGCSNYGTKSVQVDPMRPQDVYSAIDCNGIWKSSDYGQTWKGPINTGANASTITLSLANIAVAHASPSAPTVIYGTAIAGPGVGFWRSTNGGVDWENKPVLPNGGVATAVNQQFYSPAVDPYDTSHLIMAQHQTDLLVESTDGGDTWKQVALDPAMAAANGGTAGINFVDTGDPATTRTTWLWLAAAIRSVGTWRTSDGGQHWTKVESNEHVNGSMHSEVFQPSPPTGEMFMAGQNSTNGAGVFHSTDFGKTWTHLGQDEPEAVVVATPKHVYALFGWAAGPGNMVAPGFQVGAAHGASPWTSPATPASLSQGPGQAGVTYDGSNYILITGNYNAGLWRYIEPAN